MPEILPRHYIMGIVIFTLIMVGGVNILTEFQKADSNFIDTDKFEKFNRTFNKMEELDDSVGSLQDSIENNEEDPGLFGWLDALIGSVWTAIKTIFTSLGFMTSVFGGLYTIFGIPAYVGNLIATLVSVILIFSIFAILFQRDI